MSQRKWIVVGLDETGEEIERATVLESHVVYAVEVFKEFADWIEVVDPEAKQLTRTVWSRAQKAGAS